MKVTFILKNLSDEFYNGFGESIKGLLNMDDREKFERLNKLRRDLGHCISMKIGTGQFRDAVELNRLRREGCSMSFKIEPRRGYKLATFEIVRM